MYLVATGFINWSDNLIPVLSRFILINVFENILVNICQKDFIQKVF